MSWNCRSPTHAAANYLYEAVVPLNLDFDHLSRDQAIEHQTAYIATFLAVNPCAMLDGTYIYCDKSEDHQLRRDMYAGQKSRHLVKFMSTVLRDGYILGVTGPFDGHNDDDKISNVGFFLLF